MSASFVTEPIEFGDPSSDDFCVEYPNGLIDLSRSIHLEELVKPDIDTIEEYIPQMDSTITLPKLRHGQIDVPVTGEKTIRVNTDRTALVIVDMQNFFLHPDIREHPTGLACVAPLMKAVKFFREKNVKIIWLNWGFSEDDLATIPPSLARGFNANHGSRGFGCKLAGDMGRILMIGEKNTELYGPLQGLYEDGRDKGSDFWINKIRMSGLWNQTPLEAFLQKNGIKTLLFAGVNVDDVKPVPHSNHSIPTLIISQCVLGTIIDANHKGYDCILIEDTTATTSPDVTYQAALYNAGNTYGFVTCTDKVFNSDNSV
ncbi:Isochorismatase hydrolase [Lentinula raphanica]|nr:Isochorismatase hydrolase [Lentinula raphanica]KAJ3779201.1 Isochorismatase hydrolase [Lentinula raphanica]